MVLGDLLHVVDLAQVHHSLHVLHLRRGVRVEMFEEAAVVEADVVAEPRLDRLHLRLRGGHLEDAQTLTEVLARDVAVVVPAMSTIDYTGQLGWFIQLYVRSNTRKSYVDVINFLSEISL